MAKRSRSDQQLITLSLDGESFGIWDEFKGGEIDSEDLKDRAGGTWIEEAAGGPVTVGNITISRHYSLERDHQSIKRLVAMVGRAAAVVTKQPLDSDLNPFGSPLVYTGILKRVAPPEGNVNEAGIARIELEISTDGAVA